MEMGRARMGLLRHSQRHSRVLALQQLPQREQLILGIPPALLTICSDHLGLTLAGL